MAFTAEQMEALVAPVPADKVRRREVDGRELRYIEGWFALAEANRIFGFHGWSRETAELRCVQAREARGVFSAIYAAKVRITVAAGDSTIVREGCGFGEARSAAPGHAHEIALKTAETDATKRALATFGSPFGLNLYRKPALVHEAEGPAFSAPLHESDTGEAMSSGPVIEGLVGDGNPPSANIGEGAGSTVPGLHPDDMTPVPRPSRYYGAERFHETRKENGRLVREAASRARRAARRRSAGAGSDTLLPFGKVKRIRDKAHLAFVRSQPCLVCGRIPADPHHLRFAQPWGVGLKVGDEFTVPLCRTHHRELHRKGNEISWWSGYGIDPLATAKALWASTRSPPLQPAIVDDPVQQKGAGPEQ